MIEKLIKQFYGEKYDIYIEHIIVLRKQVNT